MPYNYSGLGVNPCPHKSPQNFQGLKRFFPWNQSQNFLIIKWKIYSQSVKGNAGEIEGMTLRNHLHRNGLIQHDIGADWKMVVSSWAEIVGIVTAWFCTHLVQPFAPFFPLWKVHCWLMTYTLSCLARTIVWTGGFIILERVFLVPPL